MDNNLVREKKKRLIITFETTTAPLKLDIKGLNPAVASVAMSLESVVSVIAGWILLGQMLGGREIFGCVLMFIAIIIAQLPDREYTK